MAFQDLTYRGNDELILHAVNISETLTNLAYLIGIDADQPERVRLYAAEVEERLHVLGSLLRSTGCEALIAGRVSRLHKEYGADAASLQRLAALIDPAEG